MREGKKGPGSIFPVWSQWYRHAAYRKIESGLLFCGVILTTLRGWLEVIELVGREAVLWERDPRTGNALTAAYGELAQRITRQETEVHIVDGVSDTFAGNENMRHEVKRYINALVSLIG
jgi:hypothetical protein